MRYDEKKEKGNKKGHSIIDSRRRIPQSFLRWICVRAAEENICYENNGPSVRFDWDKTRIYLVSTPPAIVPRPKNSSSNVCNGGRIKTSCLAGNLLKIQPRDCIYCSVFPNLLKSSPREKRICSNGICSKCLVYLRSLIFFFSHPPSLSNSYYNVHLNFSFGKIFYSYGPSNHLEAIFSLSNLFYIECNGRTINGKRRRRKKEIS